MKIAITTIKLFKLLVAVAVVACIAFWGYRWHVSSDADNVKIHNATVREIKDMVKLCSMEIYDEVPVKGSAGTRHLVARMRLRGMVNFDIDKIDTDLSADTIRLVLPPEEIEVLESTDDNAYMVIDTWNDKFLGSDNFTTAEENAMKAKVRDNWLRRVYLNGTVAKARAEARQNLLTMLAGIMRKPVIVTDSVPRGAHYPKYR
ncbi:MAG: hypothetical protein Q4C34_03090 [Bacteroidales bacterium]|nr:hypothetical protein [Bacteroidales bacterium]